MGNNGDIIPDDAREYVCVQELLTENIKPPEVILPFKKEALNSILASLKDTIHENLMGAVVAVGKNEMTNHSCKTRKVFWFFFLSYVLT